jgi:hypothetical protein
MSALDDVIERIRDRITNFGVEGECWPWTGTRTKDGMHKQMVRNAAFEPSYVLTRAKPYGLVKINGKRETTHKTVYRWATESVPKPDDFRLRNSCGNTLCCNPAHWVLVIKAGSMPTVGGAMTSTPTALLRQDCNDLLESLLSTHTPRTFADVQNHPYMADFPPDLIKEVLSDIGKSHLTQ